MNGNSLAVVGAGPAGISVALAAKDLNLRPLLIDRADDVGASWRGRYDRLRLNTTRPRSRLPGRRYPPGTPVFPTRDEVVAYLERHGHEDGIDLRLGTTVERVDRGDRSWVLRTSAGDVAARHVVVATGYENVPVVPPWPGRDTYTGELLHSSRYRNAEPFEDRSVLVVGPGCSGAEIAYDLVTGGAAAVALAVRTPPNIILRRPQALVAVPNDLLGEALMHVPVRVADAVARLGQRSDVGDLGPYGLPFPDEGIYSRIYRDGGSPTIVDAEVVAAIKDGRIRIVGAVASFDATGVTLADASRLEPDAVVCATGYRSGLEPLVGHLGVLDGRGLPRGLGEHAPAPGLRFVGYAARPSMLGHTAAEARRVARAVAREQHARGRPPRRAARRPTAAA